MNNNLQLIPETANDIINLLPQYEGNVRDKVIFAEKLMKQLPQRELKVEHDFSFGVYARILYIPADTILVGKLHKYPQINLIRQGELSVLVGNEIKRLKAPYVVASAAGTKRIAQVHRDTIWVTIHGTYLKDVEQIEHYFIAQDDKEYLDFVRQKLL